METFGSFTSFTTASQLLHLVKLGFSQVRPQNSFTSFTTFISR
nr:MAG TPA: hypothetical protein [Caudoviricetes sp.]